MPSLKRTLAAWQQDAFTETLNTELNQLAAGVIPLQQCLRQGSHVVEDEDYRFMLISSEEGTDAIELKIGVFFNSVIAGCACADDPTPMDTCSEYGEFLIRLDKHNAEFTTLITDN